MRIAAHVAVVITLSFLPSKGFGRPSIDEACRKGIFPALAAGNFSGSLDCRHDRLVVSQVGRILVKMHPFEVFNYRYTLRPICHGCAMRGGQRVIIMSEGHYLGQYKPYSVRMTIKHNDLILTPDTDIGPNYSMPIAVKFTKSGPPHRIWVGGEALSLFR